MAVNVTYSDLILAFEIPEDLSAKMQELDANPEIVSLTEDGTLTVKLDGEKYTLHTDLLADELNALKLIDFNLNLIKDECWGSQYFYLEFEDTGYSAPADN